MPLFARNFQRLMRETIDDIVTDTSITRITPGSKMRAITEALNKQLEIAFDTFDVNFARGFISGASGKYLDFIGDMLGVSRRGPTTAQLSSASRMAKFYVESGTFGDINNGLSIPVPAGTLIKVANTADITSYKTITSNVLIATAAEQFVSIESLTTGSLANVGLGALKYHDFTNYTDSTLGSLKVINTSTITTAQDTESDTNYRFRLSNSLVIAEKANLTAIRLSVLNTPGISDVIILPFYQGIGTFDLLIESVTPTVSTQLISSVRESVSTTAGLGSYFTVRAPREYGITMEVTLTLRDNVSADEGVLLSSSVKDTLISYINSSRIGEGIVINKLIDVIFSISDKIKNVGTTSKPIDLIHLYTPTKLEDNKTREELLDDLTPPSDARIIIEPSVASPITVRIR